eukprot:7377669-Prymnesium_polylepis.1
MAPVQYPAPHCTHPRAQGSVPHSQAHSFFFTSATAALDAALILSVSCNVSSTFCDSSTVAAAACFAVLPAALRVTRPQLSCARARLAARVHVPPLQMEARAIMLDVRRDGAEEVRARAHTHCAPMRPSARCPCKVRSATPVPHLAEGQVRREPSAKDGREGEVTDHANFKDGKQVEHGGPQADRACTPTSVCSGHGVVAPGGRRTCSAGP